MNGWAGSKCSMFVNYVNQCITIDISYFGHWFISNRKFSIKKKFLECANKLYSSFFSVN